MKSLRAFFHLVCALYVLPMGVTGMRIMPGGVSEARADTRYFTLVDDSTLDRALAEAREEFLATRPTPWTRLDAVILIPNPDGSWQRGSFNPEVIAYPASCVKLPFLAAAMYWCRINGKPYTYLDDSVAPMIRKSSNEMTGVVVDAITGTPNDETLTSVDEKYLAWLEKRRFTEHYLEARNLLGNQTILHKTYPSNSGPSPVGAEKTSREHRGMNQMQPKLSASLMLEIIKGAIEPEANEYMRNLLRHNRTSDQSILGHGLPPGSLYENKPGLAYDTVEDIAYMVLPNGREMIVAVFSDGRERENPSPHDASALGVFCEMLIEKTRLDAGCPPKVRLDNADATFVTSGTWTLATKAPDKWGASYVYKRGGTGSEQCVWPLAVPTSGRYEVSVWYSQGEDRAGDAPFTVHHANGSSTVRINQRVAGGRWIRLGDYDMKAGEGKVVLSDAISETSRIVVGDAVKAVRWPGGEPDVTPTPTPIPMLPHPEDP
jgi:protein phosphatase methylesterase 1